MVFECEYRRDYQGLASVEISRISSVAFKYFDPIADIEFHRQG
jgi:hypothetical protein